MDVVAGCPKGIKNGPCGGYKNGRCEVQKQKKCIFIAVWEKCPDAIKEEK